MKPHYHNLDTFECLDTGKIARNIFTDHARKGIYNACEHCHDDDRSLGQRLHDLNERRKKS